MKIAIASGKGGTGKTTMAVNLALVARERGGVRLIDCDVEEPNSHLFLNPVIEHRETVRVPVPQVDEDKCTACGACGEICQFSAIVTIGTKPLVFPELCHGCGGCKLVCPTGAITEVGREVGELESGRTQEGIAVTQGRLRIGEAMAPPLIRRLKQVRSGEEDVLIDAPPGTSCPVIASVIDCDFVVLVTEPTPFGLNDLKLAAEMVAELKLAAGVVINRADLGDGRVRSYCEAAKLPILAEIPDSRAVAEAYSRGEPAVRLSGALREQFEGVLEAIRDRVRVAKPGKQGIKAG